MINATDMDLFFDNEINNYSIILSEAIEESPIIKIKENETKSLFEQIQNDIELTGSNLSKDEIDHLTTVIIKRFEKYEKGQKIFKYVDNLNDILGYIVTIAGTGLGFAAVISNIVNQMHIRTGIELNNAWIFGIALAITSFALKIISAYLARKKKINKMW